MDKTKNSTDIAIENCTNIIEDYRKNSRYILLLIYFVTSTFLVIVGFSFFKEYYNDSKSISYSYFDKENDFVAKIQKIENISKKEYDSLITKAISYQKLLNAKYGGEIDFRNKFLTEKKPDFSSYILYGIFILVFGVLTSFYRFFLKEISKQEHYLVGFHRIRIAGQNSSTKYDDEVKISLTHNAFNYESSTSSKSKNIDSPIPGHPTSDITTTLLNKILDQLDFKTKDKNIS